MPITKKWGLWVVLVFSAWSFKQPQRRSATCAFSIWANKDTRKAPWVYQLAQKSRHKQKDNKIKKSAV